MFAGQKYVSRSECKGRSRGGCTHISRHRPATQFPAVTVCNMNSMHLNRLKNDDTYKALYDIQRQ